MFDEPEWAVLQPLLRVGIRAIQDYRGAHDVTLADVPMSEMYCAALGEHARLAGDSDVDPRAIWHHRRSGHGPACRTCGKPLRTPKASMCAACGAHMAF